MDKNLSQIAQNVIVEAVRKAFAENDLLKGYFFDAAGGTIRESETILKFSLRPKVIAIAKTDFIGKPLTDDAVIKGLAGPGTPILYGIDKKRGTVIRAKRVKYLFKDEANGKAYEIDFRSCRLDTERLKAAV